MQQHIARTQFNNNATTQCNKAIQQSNATKQCNNAMQPLNATMQCYNLLPYAIIRRGLFCNNAQPYTKYFWRFAQITIFSTTIFLSPQPLGLNYSRTNRACHEHKSFIAGCSDKTCTIMVLIEVSN